MADSEHNMAFPDKEISFMYHSGFEEKAKHKKTLSILSKSVRSEDILRMSILKNKYIHKNIYVDPKAMARLDQEMKRSAQLNDHLNAHNINLIEVPSTELKDVIHGRKDKRRTYYIEGGGGFISEILKYDRETSPLDYIIATTRYGKEPVCRSDHSWRTTRSCTASSLWTM